jgi:hypothetical protein
MTPTVIEVVRPRAAADRPVGDTAPAEDWARLIRALAATDEDDLPLFGRMPG